MFFSELHFTTVLSIQAEQLSLISRVSRPVERVDHSPFQGFVETS